MDKREQIASMLSCYRNATLVMAIWRSSTVEAGFLADRRQGELGTCSLLHLQKEPNRLCDFAYFDGDNNRGLITLEAKPDVYDHIKQPRNTRG